MGHRPAVWPHFLYLYAAYFCIVIAGTIRCCCVKVINGIGFCIDETKGVSILSTAVRSIPSQPVYIILRLASLIRAVSAVGTISSEH